jgi:hypothetical protein
MVLPNFQPPIGFQPCAVPTPSWEWQPTKRRSVLMRVGRDWFVEAIALSLRGLGR